MSELSTCCDSARWLETDLCNICKEHADFYDEDEAFESENLINEMETIYLISGWREYPEKVIRVDEIKTRLGELIGGKEGLR